MDHLYEALFEAAVRAEALEELEEILALGGEGALGVDVAEHGRRVARLLQVPRPPPAAQRTGEGFGVLQALFGNDGPPLLEAHAAPAEAQVSARCPACTAVLPLGEAEVRQETRVGVRSRHPVRCPRCLATGTLERFRSYRLRGIRDRVRLASPGLLGPYAGRLGCARGGRLCMLAAAVLLLAGGPWGPVAMVAVALWLRARVEQGGAALAWSVVVVAGGVGGLLGGGGLAWAVALGVAAGGALHALWALEAQPAAWAPQEASHGGFPGPE